MAPGTRGSAAFSQRTIYGAAPSPPSVSPVETWGARTLREYEELRQARSTVPVPQTALIAAGRAEGSEETVTGGARRTPSVSSGRRSSPTHSVVETARRAVRFVVAACSPRARTDEATSTLRTATQGLQISAAMAEPIPPEVGEEEEAPVPPVEEEREVPASPVEEEIAPTPQVEARPTPRSSRLFRPRPARVPPPLGDDGEVDWFHIDRVITREEITAAVGRATYNFMCHQGKVRVVYSRDPRHPPSLALLGVPQKDILPLRLYTRAALEVDLAWWDPRISEGQLRRKEVTMTAHEQVLRTDTFNLRRNLFKNVRSGYTRPGQDLVFERYWRPMEEFRRENARTLADQVEALHRANRVVLDRQDPYTTDDEAAWAEPTDGARAPSPPVAPVVAAGPDAAGPSGTAGQREEPEAAGPEGTGPDPFPTYAMSPTGTLPGTLPIPAGPLQVDTSSSDRSTFSIHLTMPSPLGSAGGYMTVSPVRGPIRIAAPTRFAAGPPAGMQPSVRPRLDTGRAAAAPTDGRGDRRMFLFATWQVRAGLQRERGDAVARSAFTDARARDAGPIRGAWLPTRRRLSSRRRFDRRGREPGDRRPGGRPCLKGAIGPTYGCLVRDVLGGQGVV